jgi:hypothetical protein
MIVYVVFCKDYEHKKGELLGMLVERRTDTRGQTAFGHLVKDKKDIFVFPKEMEMNCDDERLLVEKGIFTKEEFLEVEKKINQRMKQKAKILGTE